MHDEGGSSVKYIFFRNSIIFAVLSSFVVTFQNCGMTPQDKDENKSSSKFEILKFDSGNSKVVDVNSGDQLNLVVDDASLEIAFGTNFDGISCVWIFKNDAGTSEQDLDESDPSIALGTVSDTHAGTYTATCKRGTKKITVTFYVVVSNANVTRTFTFTSGSGGQSVTHQTKGQAMTRCKAGVDSVDPAVSVTCKWGSETLFTRAAAPRDTYSVTVGETTTSTTNLTRAQAVTNCNAMIRDTAYSTRLKCQWGTQVLYDRPKDGNNTVNSGANGNIAK